MLKALKTHWPEYLIEAFGLGLFMFVACAVSAFLWNPASPIEHLVAARPYLQRLLMGIAIGVLLVLFITFEAPFSGMSMNPARTAGSAV